MSESDVWTIHIDGAARGNPGPAAFAFVMTREGGPTIEVKGCLGSTTNNLAEYTALVRALERAVESGVEKAIIHSDSELLVKQMNGEYRVKNEGLRELYDQAVELRRRLKSVILRHVPRAKNKDADRLCNEALDGEPASPESRGEAKKPTGSSKRASKIDPARIEGVREQAMHCLRAAARRWAQGEAENPPAELVWDQLWSILEDHGVLKG